jgi:hypothetical protein
MNNFNKQQQQQQQQQQQYSLMFPIKPFGKYRCLTTPKQESYAFIVSCSFLIPFFVVVKKVVVLFL